MPTYQAFGEDLHVVIQKKWQHISGIVQRKTFMEWLFSKSKDGCVGGIWFSHLFNLTKSTISSSSQLTGHVPNPIRHPKMDTKAFQSTSIKRF